MATMEDVTIYRELPPLIHAQSDLVYPNSLVPIKMCSDCETCGLLNKYCVIENDISDYQEFGL